MPVDKKQMIAALIDSLKEDHRVVCDAARHAYDTATHEENRAENKYDTRGLEASYLARAQGRRAADLESMIHFYQNYEAPDHGENDPIGAGALVTLETEDEDRVVFMAPRGNGGSLNMAGRKIWIVTANSPLGRALTGKEFGDSVRIGDPPREWEIVGLQ